MSVHSVTDEANDDYIGFRAPRRLARTLAILARTRGTTVSQLLREMIVQNCGAA